MEKRLVLATTLSILILLLWSAMLPKKPVMAPIAVQNEQSKPQGLNLPAEVMEAPAEVLMPPLLYSQPQEEISFVESQAAIQKVIFKNYRNHELLLKNAFFLRGQNLSFKKISSTPNEIVFVHSDQNKKIIKRFLINNSNYTIDLEINVQNNSVTPLPVNYAISIGILDFKTDPAAGRYRDVAIATPNNGLLRTTYVNGRKDLAVEQPSFVAVRDQYFCNIVEPLSAGQTVIVKKLNPNETEVMLAPKEIILVAGESVEQKFRIYLGPQDLGMIKATNPAWASVINYGFFDFISQLLLQLLGFFYSLVHNWGLAIIILSVAVYFLLYPLTLKQMRSMKAMQALQPRMEELKKLYKDNPQKLHKETLELYREHKVNPLGGCLPLLLQMPIFFALYQALARSIALKGAHFLWIKDLSEPDRLARLPFNLPVLGNEFNILPILMAVVMFFQQKASSASMGSEHAEQQKIMLIVMPILFGMIFYRMPAGLVLYWFVNSLLMATYQFKINKAK
ncbi:MAG: membrane protein insertase YidC [Candidatus Omnitrophica bacterium]|jgi:YidC/Oxa1 family membrane protein insertase|nr:membrane protein insertase YidC [Candidatus Omnitrophota bacterium]